jgi:hypothetical protein
VGVIRPGEVTFVALRALKTRPDVGLDVFQHVAEVDRAIGIRQCAGYKDLSLFICHVL